MQRLVSTAVLAAIAVALGTFGQPRASAAPAPSTYANVEKAIRDLNAAWSRPEVPKDPNAPGWGVFFDAMLGQLKAYTEAQTPEDRVGPLNQLYQMSAALAPVPWQPAQTIREELRAWLRPRVQLAWAERRINERLQGLPPTNDPAVQANRQAWSTFVAGDLAQALTKYHGATTVGQRQEGLKAIHQALTALSQRNAAQPWQPSADLQNAISGLFNQPNLDITADLSIVQPLFDAPLVTTGPIFRKGYWSQVTAGPKTGFGLLPSDQGIVFYNKQMLQSTTPITDFQNQVASDQKGQRAAKMYQFTATSLDSAEQTVYATISTSGLSLTPQASHNVNAQICSTPQPGGGLTRAIAGLVGYGQNRITNEVYQNALAQFQQRIPQEAQEEAMERIAGETAQRNAQIQRFLIGNDLLAIQEFLVSGLSLRSRPDAVYVGGLFQSRTGDTQRGADAPQPTRFAAPDAGLTADVHVGSVMTSAVDALFRRPDVQAVENLMIVTHDVPPGTPPAQAATITRNVDFPTYLKAVDEARKANNPKVQALRIRRPSQPPEFAADARGFLVAIVKDVEIDVPAPDANSQAGSAVGANAKVLRIKLPQTEIALSYKVEPLSAVSYHVTGKIEDLTVPPTAQVVAIRESEADAQPLNRFSGALVITALLGRIRTQPIDASLDNVRIPGLAIRSISPVDPSGWVRVNLVRTIDQPAFAPAPQPVAATPAQPAGSIPVQVQVPAQAAVVTYQQ
ncbi:hypothetical protein [Paludisphaera mucosa]|uniref:Uncharacterized protein n=1 Tax=Paludisphaera mucosa TaxID=3030827 RepID=A0ABT6F8S5_9BACT|nr:hypothetical protein [Paludisphaera mucosa]MDG3003990.1 hypothetical protein [Paludisphaera mucosa]